MNTSYSTLYKSLFNASTTLLTTIACLSSFSAYAAQGFVDGMPTATLDKITITATRTPLAINNTIAQTQIIDSETLNTYQGLSALEVIKRQPGFSQFSYGGLGTGGNFYLRGYDNKSILVLIDGMRYSSASAGGATLNLLPAEQIERIEVLYGASGSSIYGSDAMGGVIQVFTKGNNVKRNQLSVTVGAGSNDHYLYGATAQLLNDQGSSLSLSAVHNETEGYSTVLPGGYGYNKDDDGFESDSYSLNLKHQVNNNIDVGASGIFMDSTTDIDSADDWQTGAAALDNAHADQENGAGNAYIAYSTDQYDAKLSYGYSVDKSSTYENVQHLSNPSQYDTKQQQVNLIGTYNLPTGELIYGAEHLKQSLDSNVYNVDDRKVNSGFLGYLASYNNLEGQANIRYDDYSDVDSETTFNVGAAYRFNPNIRAGVNFAKGYRAPTFNELYGPSEWGSNPNLSPETSDNYEAFLEYITLNQSTRLTGYQSNVEDMIASDGISTADFIYGKNINIEEAEISGVSLVSDWNIDDYLFGISYDYQKAKNESGEQRANDGNYLPIRPENKGMVYVGYRIADLDVRAEYQYVDDYYYDSANNTKLDSYNLVNISGNYILSPSLTLSARLNNVFNKDYVTSPGYSTDNGTNFLTSLTYTFK